MVWAVSSEGHRLNLKTNSGSPHSVSCFRDMISDTKEAHNNQLSRESEGLFKQDPCPNSIQVFMALSILMGKPSLKDTAQVL